MNAAELWPILFIAFALSLLLSFVYMVPKRGFLSAFLWTIFPLRYWSSWASGTAYDDNPVWLDRLQWGLFIAMGVLWLVGKVKT